MVVGIEKRKNPVKGILLREDCNTVEPLVRSLVKPIFVFRVNTSVDTPQGLWTRRLELLKNSVKITIMLVYVEVIGVLLS